MNAEKLARLVEALGGVDWGSLASGPTLTIESVAECVLPCFGPAGLVAADGVALFVALADLGLFRPDPDPVHDAQTAPSSTTGGHWQR